MNLKEIEKLIFENDFDWAEMVEYTETHDLVVEDFNLDRNNYYNRNFAAKDVDQFVKIEDTNIFLNFFDYQNVSKNHGDDEYLEKIYNDNIGEVIYLSLALIKDTISHTDLLQEGIVNLFETAIMYKDEKVLFEKYKTTYVVWAMVTYMKHRFDDLKYSMLKFIKEEKEKIEKYKKSKNRIKKGAEVSDRVLGIRQTREEVMANAEKELKLFEENKPSFEYNTILYLLSNEEIDCLNRFHGLFGSQEMSVEEIAKITKFSENKVKLLIMAAIMKVLTSGDPMFNDNAEFDEEDLDEMFDDFDDDDSDDFDDFDDEEV